MLFAGLLDPTTQMPRHRMFWAVLGALIAAQVAALWMLCSSQVHRADERRSEWNVQRMAVADCLRQVTGATLATCSGGTGEAGYHPENTAAPGAVFVETGRASGMVPVTFTRR